MIFKGLGGTDLLVYLAIKEMIGCAGASAEVPVEAVSEQTGLHEKTVRRSFKRLHQRHIIKRDRVELNRPYTIKLIDE